MSPVTHQPYCASLLLAGPAGGEVCKVLGLRVAFDPPVLERERVKVDRAPVNNVHNGELGLSAKRAGTVALQLLFREINHNQPVQRLWIDIDPPSLQVTGRSAELLFGLVAYLHLGAPSLPKGVPDSDFMATGLLDPDGNVGSVEAVAVKVRAALASGPKVGTRLFYPRADEAQIGDDLRAECRSLGLILCPVDRIDEALDALGVPILGSWPSSLSPFRALEAFDTRFSRVFFGRQREVEALTSLLEARAAAGRPGALVIGASGAGKSSFCLAGVLPALIKRKPGLQYAVWRPRDAASGLGDEPADEQRLAQSILSQWQVRDEKQLGMALAAAPEGAPSLQDLPACLAAEAGQCSVFVIDQFEELFTLNFTPQARIGFARLLQSLQARGIWVIGTLRSEFYASYLELADEEGQVVLTPLFEGDGQYNLPRMSRDAFSQVITRPAELAGLQFEQRANGVSLAQTLLADAMATDDALPLLGFALQKLYDAQERPETNANANATFPRTLGFAAYEKLGGLAGAIGTVAAEAYAALDAKAQAELPGLLNALAVPSADGTRETARPSPIDQWPLNTPGRRLIDTLTTIRVLVSEQGTTPDAPAIIRVAHEALFSHWEQAAKLLNDSQQNRLLIEDFRQKANIWDAEDRPRDRLLTSPRDIANATAVRPLVLNVAGNAALMAFIDTSVSRAKRQRVVWYSSAAAIALTLVGTTGWAVYEASAADHQASMARGERSRAVAQLAEQAIDRGDAMTGILLARSQLVQGDEANWTSAAQGALVRGVLANLEIATLHGGADEAAVSDATFSFDSNHVITQLEGGAVWYRENIGRGRPSLKLSGSSSYAFIRKISQDRRSIMTAYQGGNFEIMGLDGKILKLSSLIDKNNYLPDFDFSNDGMKFVSVFPDYGTIRFWTYNGKITANVIFSGDAGHEGIVSSYGFSPNGQYAITASDDGMIRAWLISGNQVTSRILHRHQGGIVSISFSPDSRHIVAVFDDRTAQIIPLGDDNGLPIVLNGHDGPLTSASFSPDGRKVVTTSSDATSRVWMLSEARLSSILLVGHEKMVTSASFSPDSQRVVTTSADQTARVWTLAGDRTSSMLLTGHNGMITRAEFSGDGRHVVTTSTDRSARVWRINGSGGAFEILPSHSEHERYLAISSNGKYILERRIDGSVRIITLNAGKLTYRDIIYGLSGNRISSATFSGDLSKLITEFDDGSIYIWKLNQSVATSIPFVKISGEFALNSFSADGSYIVTYENSGVVKIHKLNENVIFSKTVGNYDSTVSQIAVSLDGKRVAAASEYGIRLWSLTGSNFKSIDFGEGVGTAERIKFNSGNDKIFTMHGDGTVRIWNVHGRQLKIVKNFDDGAKTDDFDISYDGNYIVTTSGISAKVLNLLVKPTIPIDLVGHMGVIQSAAFSPDGRRILTTSGDGTVRLWIMDKDRATSVLLAENQGEYPKAHFSRSGRFIIISSGQGAVRRLYVPSGKELLDFSASLLTRCLTVSQRAVYGIEKSTASNGSPCA